MSHPLYIAFIWHMHQPVYRDLATGRCSMPWVRLHATKDYLDMVLRLEDTPAIHQTFNLVPSLLDQLDAYLPPHRQTDDFLALSRRPAAELSDEERRFLVQWFFLANLDRMIRPHPRYHDLLSKRGLHLREEERSKVLKRFHAQDCLDLQVWFNLAWIDPWLRRQDPVLARLEAKGSQFTEEEKHQVLDRHLELIGRVIPAYRSAAEKGIVELTTSPYYHPILPLLCEVKSAHAALPHLPLPDAPFRHPEDARWQLEAALQRHRAAFGAPPAGLWPSEGSVSEEVVRLAIDLKVRWMATDEGILWRTLKASRALPTLYRPHMVRRPHGQLAMVFRDRELSDLVGFVYSQWDPTLAVADFLKRLGDLHQQFRAAPQPALVSIVLDGENAWEFYPDDGHEFLSGLYRALAADKRFRCVTVSEFLEQYPPEHTASLPEIFSGSWIDTNFATWVGHPEKNAAWRHLAGLREALEAAGGNGPAHEQARKHLGAAEGSDWMWWFGDTHFSAQAEEFDRMFRTHLSNGYRALGLDVPEALDRPIKRRSMALLHVPTGLIHPTIDGRETSYYEWLYAGRLDLSQQYAAIQRGSQCLRTLYFGFDRTHYYLRLDLDTAALSRQPAWSLDIALPNDAALRVAPSAPSATGIEACLMTPGAPDCSVPCALGSMLELALPLEPLGVGAGEPLRLAISLLAGGEAVERYPAQETFELPASVADLEAHAWPL
jgi:alpha-amylase/alpha-mannosidase (GH57 family)